MPRYFATYSMVSFESQPFSSCAMMSALITADCFWSGGYLATSRSIFRSESVVSMANESAVHVPEHDIERADNCDRVGEHVALGELVHRREVAERGRAQLHAVGLVRAVGDEIDGKFALGVLDRGVGLALGHVHALGEELEVVDELLHAELHLAARRRRHLVVVDDH